MTNSTLRNVYKNLKKYRIEKNLSQAELAAISDISVDYISLIENGKRTPSLKRLIILAESLNIDVYKLFL